jgi:cytochrome c553
MGERLHWLPKNGNSNKIAPFVVIRGQALLRALALFALVTTMGGSLAQDAAKAQQIAGQVCAACHAADGNSVAPANPKIAGQIPEYLHKQLADFKGRGGKKPLRPSAIMEPMVANLSEADMKGLAAFYAGQQIKPSVAADKELAALGQKLWRGGNAATGVPACAGCHGPSGAGIPAQYPRLSGQFAEYVVAQLKLFRDGGRANDPNGMMRAVAERLTEREIRALAEYAAGLR